MGSPSLGPSPDAKDRGLIRVSRVPQVGTMRWGKMIHENGNKKIALTRFICSKVLVSKDMARNIQNDQASFRASPSGFRADRFSSEETECKSEP